ncbi:MAG: ribbon-helix-helix domain-containing protein [Deltaproteobacteria bacterium]|nr:ribbon-helix-helix domain-containing protein [Deltaproteobacteria bacterium]
MFIPMENIVSTISFPRELEQKLKEFAKSRGKPKNSLIQEAVREYLERREIELIERKLQARGRSLGIESEEDVVDLVRKVRKRSKR